VGESLEHLARMEQDWLRYAWRIVNCPDDHRRGCFADGGAQGPGVDGSNQLRFPGSLGRDYRGLLCAALVHLEPSSDEVTATDMKAGSLRRGG
jgi:hypothetical protein